MTTITARNQTYDLRRECYWHLTPAQGSHLLHNAHNGQGICWSTSAIRRAEPDAAAVTFYGAFGNVDRRTLGSAFERPSTKTYRPGNTPSFLFDDKAMADRSLETWFPNEKRLLLDARVDTNARTQRADSRWLDCDATQWAENAERYWRGEMSEDPLPEIVVDGAVYFPGWKEKPFGFFAGLLPQN
jgi:hypothetical protein